MSTTLVEAPKQNLSLFDIPGCEFSPTSFTLPDGLSFDHWERIGRQLQLADLAVQWWIGDWLNYGESRYGEKYAQAIDEFGRKKQTLMNYAYVAKAIEPSRRREIVDFSTHAEIASLKPADQEKVLAKAAKEHLSVKRTRREVEKIKREGKPKPKETDFVLSKEARAFLDDYVGELARIEESIPGNCPSLWLLLHKHGKDALWQRGRTIEMDCKAITEMFSGYEGTEGVERAPGGDISAWLEKVGYCVSDDDLEERLAYMVENRMLRVLSVEDSRQAGRRGTMLDIYGLHPDYAAKLDEAD